MTVPDTRRAALSPVAETSVPTLDIAELLQRPDAVVVDLRSPSEFAEDHYPGARNVPLFDDLERGAVGLLYKQVSPDAAFARGLDLVLQKIHGFVRQLADLAGWELDAVDLEERVMALAGGGIARLEAQLTTHPWESGTQAPLVLHCWRGGLRSRSVIALLRRLGLDHTVGLEGGYRAYRTHVRGVLEDFEAPRAIVLRGLTGVGKTLVLRELERQRPGWTVDLEGAAGHRSSLLGMVGLAPCSQKTFESRLALRLAQGFPGPMVVEGESRRVGDAIIPRSLWEPLTGGTNIELVADQDHRIDVLVADYLGNDENREPLRVQLALVEPRMQGRFALVELLDAGRDRELVAILLEHYYDPLYRHSEGDRSHALTLEVSDPLQAAAEVAAWVDSHPI